MKLIIEKRHAAAFYLTKHPESTVEEVGAYVGASKRTIERWSTTAAWHTALDNIGFTGDRGWRRNLHPSPKMGLFLFLEVSIHNYSTSQGPFNCEDLASPRAAFVTYKALHGGFFVLQCGWCQRASFIALQLFYLTLTSARANVFAVGSSRKSQRL